MHIIRIGTAAVVGAISGGVAAQPMAPIALPAIGPVGIDALVEVGAVVIGAGAQILSPMTVPSIAHGLVEGGAALLARRGVYHVLKPAGKYSGGWEAAWQANGVAGARFGNVHAGSRGNVYTQPNIKTFQIN